MIKVIIAGGRDFNDRLLMNEKLKSILSNTTGEIEIVSGGQCSEDKETGDKYGADYLGELWAKQNGYNVKVFPADWKNQGRSAGPKRNKQMAEYATHLIAFWDGKSKGTRNMIGLASYYKLKTRVIRY